MSLMEEAAPVQPTFIEHLSWVGPWALHGMGEISRACFWKVGSFDGHRGREEASWVRGNSRLKEWCGISTVDEKTSIAGGCWVIVENMV